MPFVNLPPTLSEFFDNLDKRVRRLETAVRFTIPVVSATPSSPRDGDMYIKSTNSKLYVWYNGHETQIANL